MFLKKKQKTFFSSNLNMCAFCCAACFFKMFLHDTSTFLKCDISKKICYICITIQTPTMKTQMSVALKSYDDLNNRFMYRYLI